MSANAATTAPTGRNKAIGQRPSALANPAQPPAALGHGRDSQNTPAPKGRKTLAQGNALGNPPPETSSPEGAIETVAIPLPDQIRTVRATLRDRVFTEVFPEVFGKGNDFCKKITHQTTGEAPKPLIAAFRNSYHPRITVTVDTIATGTDATETPVDSLCSHGRG